MLCDALKRCLVRHYFALKRWFLEFVSTNTEQQTSLTYIDLIPAYNVIFTYNLDLIWIHPPDLTVLSTC